VQSDWRVPSETTHQTFSPQTSGIWHPASDIKHSVPKHPASDIGHQASNIRHLTPDIISLTAKHFFSNPQKNNLFPIPFK
jgi:hypothetical protein